MYKKIILIGIIFVLCAGIAVAAVLFLFPYEPDQSPQADNTGSTEQGIKDVVDANNQFAFDLYSELDKNEDGNMFYSP